MLEAAAGASWQRLGATPLLALLISGASLWCGLRYLGRFAADLPNERSLHRAPTPRFGGIGLVAGVLAGWALLGTVAPLWFALVIALAALSFVDDLRGLSASLRLLAHLAAAAVLAFALGPQQPWWAIAVLAFLIGWVTNLYNFMDGTDGLAGGMAVIGFGVYGVAALAAGAAAFAGLAWAVAGAAIGFLCFNFPPARLFLGDSGSIPLGFLAGALGYAGWAAALWPAWFPGLVFSLFIVDATVTVARRVRRGALPWQAHREHAYQRLVLSGWTHRRLALSAYAVMLASGVTALCLRDAATYDAVLGLAAWGGLYWLALVAVDRRWRRHGERTA